MPSKYYVVWKGRRTGIFTSWEEASAQVQGFAGAQFKSFSSLRLAREAFQGDFSDHAAKSGSSRQWLFAPHPPIAGSWCVDAACSGSPGRLEYRGVELDTGRQIFRRGPYEHGTNNVGEFLAIVHALALLKKKSAAIAVYSDSATGISWVKANHCNTDLLPDKKNVPLFELIRTGEAWLAKNDIHNRILKWDTQAWGEIPADFNRK